MKKEITKEKMKIDTKHTYTRKYSYTTYYECENYYFKKNFTTPTRINSRESFSYFQVSFISFLFMIFLRLV